MTPSLLPEGCQFVDAFVLDINGVARGKRLPAADFLAALGAGVAFSASSLVLDASGTHRGPLGIGTNDGDPDGNAIPVAGQIQPVPWSHSGVAQSLLSMRRDGAPLWFDPREVLAGVVARLNADGLYPVVACELEFYLVHQGRGGRLSPPHLPDGTRPGHAGHLCLQRVEDYAAFLHAAHAGLAAQGISAGTMVSEYGPGQFEVNLRHTDDPLLAADQACLMRRAVQGVAAAHGQRASFMSKPYAGQAGSGLHVHVSLVDEAGRNCFGNPEGGQKLLESAIAGMQALHAESMAFFAPSFGAWRRYAAGAFVSGLSDWGENTRAVAFRIPPGVVAARRVEHRVAGAEASPHLVLAAILAGVHYGVMHALRPSETAGAMPRNLFEALGTLEQGTKLAGYLPDAFPALFAALRRAETEAVLAEPSAAELEFYL